MRNQIVLNDAARLVHGVKEVTGRINWQKTASTLKAHFEAENWQADKARDLIRRNVREAKQYLLSSADTPAVELATDALLVELVAGFMRDARECLHPRKQRQCDEYYCPSCNKRWEVE